ncbi:hypothetical protein LLEC1_05667 [Akanthomyces lecanii]|uniref:DUF5648 domain-containing protein n=1 Tax=Cordyceps confragosa TaxID=2714763 RepID=A0A179I4C7_CORDF|nr:hypothetical protein LLEC1_05667 [Akanthomyces lecanii]
MRFFTVLATLCAAASAAPAAAEVQAKLITELWRAYSGTARDHFYTTDYNEYNNAVTNLGYAAEGVAARIYSRQADQSDEGVTGFVFTTDSRGDTVPLYRGYSGAQGDHFYTVNAAEMENAVRKLGYTYEGVAAYVFEP